MRLRTRIPERLFLCAALAITVGLIYLNAVSFGETEDNAPKPVVPVTHRVSAADERIYSELDKPTQLEMVETSLSDVAIFLSEKHDIPIVLDTRVLDGVGIATDTPITISLKKVSLRSALRLMLRQLDLTWDVRDEVLLITTPEELDSRLETHVYDIPDLVASPNGGDSDPELLIDLIMSTVVPDSWDVVGGSGSVAERQGTLVISQSHEVHSEVQALLTVLRQAKHALEKNPRNAFTRRWNIASRETAATQKIYAALEKPIKVEFVETAMSDIVNFIANATDISILLDTRALDEIGIGTDYPITANLSGISLRSALRIMLNELELKAIVRNEVLVITSAEEAEAQLSTSTFLVRDLLGPAHVAGADADSLIDLVVTTVAPDSWNEVGGAGSIQYFELIDGLVVSQTDDAQDQVAELLAKFRKIREQRDPWTLEKWQKQRVEFLATPQFQTYTIHQQPTGQLAVEAATVTRFLERTLPKEMLNDMELTINNGSITMFLTPPQAAKVDALLRKAKLPVSRSLPNAFGGGGFGSGGLGAGSGGGFF